MVEEAETRVWGMLKQLEFAGQGTSEEVAVQEGCQKFILGIPSGFSVESRAAKAQDKTPLGLSENILSGEKI